MIRTMLNVVGVGAVGSVIQNVQADTPFGLIGVIVGVSKPLAAVAV